VTINSLLVTKTGFAARGWTSSSFPFTQSLSERAFNARNVCRISLGSMKKRRGIKTKDREAKRKLKALKENVVRK